MKLISMDIEMFEWHRTAVFDYGISNYSPNYTHSESIQSLNRNFCRMFFYACQIGSKYPKIVFYIFKHNIYVRIAIYMSELQYKIIRPSRCMGFGFILPRCNVIFDIYIAGAASTYITACKLMQMS